jgi:hypothetical protein
MTYDKKPGLGLMLKGGKNEGSDAEESGESQEEADYESAKADAGGAVMKALKAGDAEAFVTTLEDFVKLCQE